MKSKTKSVNNNKWKVGLMVAIGFLLFTVAIFILGKQQNLFGSTFVLKTVFPSVSGLQVGNNVRYNGINIGTVNEIILMNDSMVLVRMLVEENKKPFIRKNSRCIISSEGLMGDKLVTVTSGTPEFEVVKDNDLILADAPIEMDEIVGSIRNTAANAEIITSELAVLMDKVNNGNGTISRLLTDSTMADDITATMNNLKKGSKSLDENMDAAKNSFLLRGAFKKKKKEEEKKQQEQEDKKDDKK